MSASELAPREFPGSPARVLAWCAGVAALAVAVRALVSFQDLAIIADGPRYIGISRDLLAGDFWVLARDDFHPLTSMLMALGTLALGLELETSGRVLSVLAGGAASVAVFLLARDQFGAKLAAVSSLLFAVHPRLVQASASVQSDGIYLMLALFSALFAFRMLDRSSARSAGAAGLLCGLAYLARPEGLAVAVVAGLWLLLDVLRGRLSWRLACWNASALMLALGVVAGPYLAALYVQHGDLEISRKKPVAALLRVDRPLLETGRPAAERWAKASSALAVENEAARRAMNAVFLGLLILGVRRGRPERRTLYVASYVGLMAWLLFGLALTAGYTSGRHWLTSVALLSPFSARGLPGLAAGIRVVVPTAPWRPLVAPGVVAVLVAALLGHAALSSEDPNKVARKQAAVWLREHREPAVVAAKRARPAYYAGATRAVVLESGENKQAALDAARAQGADYGVVDESWLAGREFQSLHGVALIHTVPYPGGSVLVLEFAPDPVSEVSAPPPIPTVR